MGAFAKAAAAAVGDWESKLQGQQDRLNAVIPSTEQETTLKALAKLKAMRQGAFSAGYGMRSQARTDPMADLLNELKSESIPTREHSITLPGLAQPTVKKALLGPIINPIKHGVQDLRAGAAQAIDKQLASATRVTDDPATLPWYYPQAALQTPRAFSEGYQQADKDHAKTVNTGLDKQIASAREQFNRALQEEYKGRRKAASAGELIDELAIKTAAGELNTAAGVYGALAGLLGTGAYHQAKGWTEDHDPRVMKAKALKELIRTRMRNSPPVVRVEAPGQELVETPQ